MDQEKSCGSCEQLLTLDQFYPRYDVKNGYSTECRTCRRDRSKRRYESKNAFCKATIKNWFDTKGRFLKYGLTAEQYQQALDKQGGCCKLCGASEPGGKGKWHIDHAHNGLESRRKFRQSEADSFRGLLCHKCNISLGHYEKLIGRLPKERIDAYLNSKL